jgi:hypothetical protein
MKYFKHRSLTETTVCGGSAQFAQGDSVLYSGDLSFQVTVSEGLVAYDFHKCRFRK